MKLFGMFIPIGVFVLYLIFSHTFNDFLDYAIFGIQTFSNKISFLELIKSVHPILKIVCLYLPFSFLILTYSYLKNKNRNLLVFITLGLSMFSVLYPISDYIHFLAGSVIILLGNIYYYHR